jgi:hypothetical protein
MDEQNPQVVNNLSSSFLESLGQPLDVILTKLTELQ